MKLYYSIAMIAIIFLAGCSTPDNACQNTTIERNITVIQEVNASCPQCINTTEYINISVPDTNCNKQLLTTLLRANVCAEDLSRCLNNDSGRLVNDLYENISDLNHDIMHLNNSWIDFVDDMNDTIRHLRLRLNESNITE